MAPAPTVNFRLSPERLLSRYFCDPEQGLVYSRFRGRTTPLKPLQTKSGYFSARPFGVDVMFHRLVWVLHYGKWPEGYLDHINGDRRDNRIANLREATAKQNAWNRPGIGSTGFKGVTLHKKSGRYQAAAMCRYLGLFETPEQAHRAYLDAVASHYGEFINTSHKRSSE